MGGAIQTQPCDFDLDGDMDIVVSGLEGTVLYFVNPGNGQFGTGVSLDHLAAVYDVAAVDLNNDSYPEIVVACQDCGALSQGGIYWYLNQRDGTFGARNTATTDGTFMNSPVGILGHDVNNDGWNDIVVTNQKGPVVWLANNNGVGTFTPIMVANYGADVLYGCCLADIDRDGILDLITGGNGGAFWLKGTGGTFSSTRTMFPNTASTTWMTRCDAADITGDGWPDVAITTTLYPGAPTDGLYLFKSSGGGVYQAPVALQQLQGSYGVEIYDIDQDGLLDIMFAAIEGLAAGWVRNLGGGTFSSYNIIVYGNYPSDVHGADFDHDNVTDILVSFDSYYFCTGWYSVSRCSTPAPATLPVGASNGTCTCDLQASFNGAVTCSLDCQWGYAVAADPAPSTALCRGTAQDPEWVGQNITCLPRLCQTVNVSYPIEVGNCTNAYFATGASCTLGCASGYIASGNISGECLALGGPIPAWSNQQITCTPVACADLDASQLPPLATAGNCTKGVFPNTCFLGCQDGYELVPNSELLPISCGADGKWTEGTIFCQLVVTTQVDNVTAALLAILLALLFMMVTVWAVFRYPRDVFYQVSLFSTALYSKGNLRVSLTTKTVDIELESMKSLSVTIPPAIKDATSISLVKNLDGFSAVVPRRVHEAILSGRTRFIISDEDDSAAPTTIVPRFKMRSNLANKIIIVGVLIDLFQYCALVFNPVVPWSTSSSSGPSVIRTTLLLIPQATAWRIAFWIMFTLVTLWWLILLIILSPAGKLFTRRTAPKLQTFIIEYYLPIVGQSLYLTAISCLLAALACSRSSLNPTAPEHLTIDPTVVCWQGAHLGYAIPAAVTILIFYPAAVYTLPLWQTVTDDLDIRYATSHLLIDAQSKLLVGVVSGMFPSVKWVSPLVCLLCLSLLLTTTLYRFPSVIHWMRLPLVAMYSAAGWAAIASFAAIGLPNNVVSSIVLYVGWAVILLVFIVTSARMYQRRSLDLPLPPATAEELQYSLVQRLRQGTHLDARRATEVLRESMASQGAELSDLKSTSNAE